MKKRVVCLLLAIVLVFANMAFTFADSTYTVKSGDVLWKIAEQHNMTWQQLAKTNNLKNPHLIYPGQVLKLGDEVAAVSSASTKESSKAVTQKPAAAVAVESGSFVGEGTGIHGAIQVSVKYENGKIADIKVLQQEETPGIGDAAINRIVADVLKYQSLGVDSVAGASYSSKGIMAAITQALEKAGANIQELKSKPAKDSAVKETITKQADVIVVGGGGAGLAAATSAAEKGASVILIEKGSALGGNTIRAGGAFNAVDPKRQSAVKMTKPLLEDLKFFLNEKESDYGDFGPTLATLKTQINDYLNSGKTDVLFDSVELHMIQAYIGGKRTDLKGNTITGKLDLVRTLCTNAPKSIEWLESYGLKFKDSISTVLGALWPRTHGTTQPVGTGFINTLKAASDKMGVQFMLETKGTELIMENGKVTGIKAVKSDGTPVILKANKGVVMATGGFGANPAMVAKYNTYWEKIPNDMKTTNTPNATGDGIVMGEAVGADLVGMGFVQLMPSSHPVTGALSGGVWGSAESQVFVNKDGKRFVNEYAERDVLSKAALAQKDSLFYIICDKNTAGILPTGKNGWGDNIEDLIKTKSIYKADTLEDLAKQIGVPADNLVNEIKEYNSYIDNGNDPDFGKKNFGPKIEVGPFYATPRSPSIHHTMGGLAIDSSTHVLDKNGKAIPGFYAAGEVTGGIHAGNRLGGNAIADIITFGRIAGDSAANMK
jgi:fumarate reductase flavoprotein subunit